PLGLVVGDGKETSPLRKVDQGLFLISMGKPVIQHTRDPLPAAVETALLSGPRLVVNGKALQLKPQVSRRTSICLPGDGTVMLVVFATPISLADLAESLARPAAEGGLGCWSALNLDGGPSTQLSVATPGLHLEVEGGWGVPNGLAILPKPAAPTAPPPRAETAPSWLRTSRRWRRRREFLPRPGEPLGARSRRADPRSS